MTKQKNILGFQALIEKSQPKSVQVATKPIVKLMDKVFLFKKLNHYLSSFMDDTSYSEFCDHIVNDFNISVRDFGDIVDHLPKEGPCVVVCNHPMGFPETFIVPQQIYRVRKDVKILANDSLSNYPLVEDSIIPIDVYSPKAKIRQVKSCLEWLDSGGVLVIFPAGEISDYSHKEKVGRDNTWSEIPFKLARKHQASFIHVHITGRNSALFYITSMINKALRVVWLSRELYNKRNKEYEVRASRPINLSQFNTDDVKQLSDYFYAINYALPLREKIRKTLLKSSSKNKHPFDPAVIVLPNYQAAIDEIETLSDKHVLYQLKSYTVYCASAEEIPETLNLIQRAREKTFRQIGMGSGKPKDADQHDQFAKHLFIWDHGNNKLVGSYRYRVLTRGDSSSYIGDFYKINYESLLVNHDFIECSRTFVMPDYQKSFIALLCLWRGLGQVLLQQKKARYFGGLVSIPANYLPPLFQDITSVFVGSAKTHHQALAEYFECNVPYVRQNSLPNSLYRAAKTCHSISQLENLFFQLAGDTFKLPTLFRQYESLGMSFVEMSVDPEFGGCIDLLGVWDVKQTIPGKLKTFIGKDGEQEILQRFQLED